MKHIIITNEKGEVELKTEYTKEVECALQYYLKDKQLEKQNGNN